MPVDRTIEGRKCSGCGHNYFGEAEICSRCGNRDFRAVQYSGKGIIYSFTLNYVPPLHLQDAAPYAVGIVDLEEGLRVTVRLDLPKSELKIGKEVLLKEKTSTGLVFG